jgi:hypothetical protein
MTPSTWSRTVAGLGVIGAVTAACLSTPAALRGLAGRYELRSVNGAAVPVDALGGALRGELVLTATGRATRTVLYARSGLPEPVVHRAAGSYRVRGSGITLSLAVQDSASPWRANGEIRSPSIIIRYPGRSDRMVEEEYVKVGRE